VGSSFRLFTSFVEEAESERDEGACVETQPYWEITGALAYVGVCGGAAKEPVASEREWKPLNDPLPWPYWMGDHG